MACPLQLWWQCLSGFCVSTWGCKTVSSLSNCVVNSRASLYLPHLGPELVLIPLKALREHTSWTHCPSPNLYRLLHPAAQKPRGPDHSKDETLAELGQKEKGDSIPFLTGYTPASFRLDTGALACFEVCRAPTGMKGSPWGNAPGQRTPMTGVPALEQKLGAVHANRRRAGRVDVMEWNVSSKTRATSLPSLDQTAREHPVSASWAGRWAAPPVLEQSRDGEAHCQLDQQGTGIRERTCSIVYRRAYSKDGEEGQYLKGCLENLVMRESREKGLNTKSSSTPFRRWDEQGMGGGRGICICITDSLCHRAETNTTFSINYMPIRRNEIGSFVVTWVNLDCHTEGFPQRVMNPPAMQETWVQSLGWEDPL